MKLLRRLSFLWFMVAAIALSPNVRAAPALEAYGRLPGVERIALSPSGKYYAFIASQGTRRSLGVASLAGKIVLASDVGDSKIRGLQWVNDERLVVYKSATVDERFRFRYEYELTAAIIVDIKTGAVSSVFENKRSVAHAVFGDYGVYQVDGRWLGFFGGLTYGKTKTGQYFKDGYPDLYRVDLESGGIRMIDEASSSSKAGWAVLPTGAVAAHVRYNDKNGNWRLYRGEGTTHLLFELTTQLGEAHLSGLGRTTDTVLIAYRTDEEDLYEEVSLSDGTRVELFTDHSVVSILRNPLTGELIGARIRHKDEAVFFDPLHQARYQGMRKAFSGYQVELLSFTPDLERMITRTDGKDDAGTYWFVDIKTGEAIPIGSDYPDIGSNDVAPTELFSYKAGDGLEIEAVLTLPRDREAKKLPLVVLPHGGPIGVSDEPGFDYWAQAFAANGYAVVQPNYRGSSGYGRSFRKAGFGQWGRKMLSDISDSVTALAGQGIVDPTRVCIVGASYGGYAALAGVTLQQDIYRCAVGVAGVYDLADFFYYSGRYHKHGNTVLRFWKAAIGEDDGTGISRSQISPVKHAANVTVPVLLMHGEDDTVVPIQQSKTMYKALKRVKNRSGSKK